MATREELKNIRLQKLHDIQKTQGLAYPGAVQRTGTIAELLKKFSSLAKSQKEVVAAGRIRSIRGHGGSAFLHIADGTSALQVFFKKDRLGEELYRFFGDTFDIGDFISVRGILFTTGRGEKTMEVAGYKVLAKSLLPLPDKWHGLQDMEERYRKRYLDLIFNPEVKEGFQKRAALVRLIRSFLDKEGFVEVETPILQPLYGGAEAKPFTTHLNAFNMPMYLRIAPELYLKRLIVGGFEKVYEIGRVFRNEGVDRSHNPDFTMLEFYQAYADYKDLMKLTERLLTFVVKGVVGKGSVLYEGKEINFKTPWPRIEYAALLRKFANVDIDAENQQALFKKAQELGVPVEGTMSKFQVIDALYKKFCLPKLWDPTFIIHYPAGSKPLAKLLDDDRSKHANFQLVVAGWEMVNAFSEQNNPLEQREVFAEQVRMRKAGMEDAHPMDEDFLEALEYGMPPTAGFGMGIDRLAALLTGSHALREVILFPTMKPKQD